MEIIAVYWESKIKTYGFNVKTNLCLTSATLSGDQIAEWGDRIEKNSNSSEFIMTLVQITSGQTLKFHCLIDPAQCESKGSAVEDLLLGFSKGDARFETPVELVYFQGPHFGDRYGIAAAAFGTLEAQGIRVLAAGCTGASIYIVVPDRMAQAVIGCLSCPFQIPETTI